MSKLDPIPKPFWRGEPPPAPPSLDVPAFNMDEVHRRQILLFRDAERVLGPCVHDYTIEPARFVMGTTGQTIRMGHTITIDLEQNAAMDWQCCVAELGHELVHALDGLRGDPTWLEEGIACAFGLGQCAAWFDDTPMYFCTGRYREALKMVASIPDQFAVVKTLRAQGIPLCRITASHLMDAAPRLDAATAMKLCERFRSSRGAPS